MLGLVRVQGQCGRPHHVAHIIKAVNLHRAGPVGMIDYPQEPLLLTRRTGRRRIIRHEQRNDVFPPMLVRKSGVAPPQQNRNRQ